MDHASVYAACPQNRWCDHDRDSEWRAEGCRCRSTGARDDHGERNEGPAVLEAAVREVVIWDGDEKAEAQGGSRRNAGKPGAEVGDEEDVEGEEDLTWQVRRRARFGPIGAVTASVPARPERARLERRLVWRSGG